jgi:hypothetical protein
MRSIFTAMRTINPGMCMFAKAMDFLKFWLEPVDLADDNGRMKVQEVRRAKELH